MSIFMFGFEVFCLLIYGFPELLPVRTGTSHTVRTFREEE